MILISSFLPMRSRRWMHLAEPRHAPSLPVLSGRDGYRTARRSWDAPSRTGLSLRRPSSPSAANEALMRCHAPSTGAVPIPIRFPVPCQSAPTGPMGQAQRPRFAMPTPVDSVIAAARDFLGERITTNATLREHHSHGQDTQPPVLPDAVAFIETSDEAARLLALCNHARVPVVAWGAGTSLEGHVTPVRGGITLDLSRMTRIIEVSQPDMDCRIEAGVTP